MASGTRVGHKKYALFGTGSATVLIYNSDAQKQDVEAAGTEDDVGQDGVAAPVEALDKTVVVSHSGRVFEDLHAIHINGGHCKARTFLNRVKAQFGKSVPERLVQLYVECCPQCTVQKPRKTVTAGHKPILTKGFGARGQVDLVDFQSCPDGSFKYLLNYQDHGIKLYDNRALTSKRTEAIAFALLDIFTFIVAPAILQTDNGREFSGATGKSVALNGVSFNIINHP